MNAQQILNLTYEFIQFGEFLTKIRKNEKKEIYAAEFEPQDECLRIDTEWLSSLDRVALDNECEFYFSLRSGKLNFRFETIKE